MHVAKGLHHKESLHLFRTIIHLIVNKIFSFQLSVFA